VIIRLFGGDCQGTPLENVLRSLTEEQDLGSSRLVYVGGRGGEERAKKLTKKRSGTISSGRPKEREDLGR